MTFARRRNRLTTNFSERILVDKRSISVQARTKYKIILKQVVYTFIYTGTVVMLYTHIYIPLPVVIIYIYIITTVPLRLPSKCDVSSGIDGLLHKPNSLATGRWGEGILYCGSENWRVLSTGRFSLQVLRILRWLRDFWKSCEIPDH